MKPGAHTGPYPSAGALFIYVLAWLRSPCSLLGAMLMLLAMLHCPACNFFALTLLRYDTIIYHVSFLS